MQTKDMNAVYSTLTQLENRGDIKKAEQIIKNIPQTILAAPIPTRDGFGKIYLGYNMLGKCLVNRYFNLANIIIQQAHQYSYTTILLDEFSSAIHAIARGIYFSESKKELQEYKFLLDKMISILKPSHPVWNISIKLTDFIEGTIIVALIRRNLLKTAKIMLAEGITLTFKTKTDIVYHYQNHPVIQAIYNNDYQFAKKLLKIPSCFSDKNSYWYILYHLIFYIEEHRMDKDMEEILENVIQNCPDLENIMLSPHYSRSMNLLEYALVRENDNLAILLLQTKKFSASQIIKAESKTYNVLMFCLLHFDTMEKVIHHLISRDQNYNYYADFINNTGETALILGAKKLPSKSEYDEILVEIAKNTLINWDLAEIKEKYSTTALNIILRRNQEILPTIGWWSWKKKNYLLLEDKEIVIFPQTVKYLREKESTQTIDL